jgi:hypothetical protein
MDTLEPLLDEMGVLVEALLAQIHLLRLEVRQLKRQALVRLDQEIMAVMGRLDHRLLMLAVEVVVLVVLVQQPRRLA